MIVLGRITAPYGVKGWVRVHPFGDDPQQWGTMPQWWLGAQTDAKAEWHSYALEECKVQPNGVVAKFRDIDSRSGAEKLLGMYIAAPREALPTTAQDEYYWGDLIGLEVVNLAGESLGKVTEMISGGAHDVLCVRDEVKQERLLPCVGQVVKQVNLAQRRMVVDWGLDF